MPGRARCGVQENTLHEICGSAALVAQRELPGAAGLEQRVEAVIAQPWRADRAGDCDATSPVWRSSSTARYSRFPAYVCAADGGAGQGIAGRGS